MVLEGLNKDMIVPEKEIAGKADVRTDISKKSNKLDKWYYNNVVSKLKRSSCPWHLKLLHAPGTLKCWHCLLTP